MPIINGSSTPQICNKKAPILNFKNVLPLATSLMVYDVELLMYLNRYITLKFPLYHDLRNLIFLKKKMADGQE